MSTDMVLADTPFQPPRVFVVGVDGTAHVVDFTKLAELLDEFGRIVRRAVVHIRAVVEPFVKALTTTWRHLVLLAGGPRAVDWYLDPKHHPIPRRVRLERRAERRRLRAYGRRRRAQKLVADRG